MEWLVVRTASENQKTMINAESILKISYHEDTNLTVIDFIRSAYPSLYVRGDITTDVKRLLNNHNHYVTQIGG